MIVIGKGKNSSYLSKCSIYTEKATVIQEKIDLHGVSSN